MSLTIPLALMCALAHILRVELLTTELNISSLYAKSLEIRWGKYWQEHNRHLSAEPLIMRLKKEASFDPKELFKPHKQPSSSWIRTLGYQHRQTSEDVAILERINIRRQLMLPIRDSSPIKKAQHWVGVHVCGVVTSRIFTIVLNRKWSQCVVASEQNVFDMCNLLFRHGIVRTFHSIVIVIIRTKIRY